MWAAGHAARTPWLQGARTPARALFMCTELCGSLPEVGLGLSPCFALPSTCSSGLGQELLTLTMCPGGVFLLQVSVVTASKAEPGVWPLPWGSTSA